jgi:hypothetical protein
VADSFKPETGRESVLSRWSRLKRGREENNNEVSKIDDSSSLARLNRANGDDADNAFVSKNTGLTAANATSDSLTNDVKALELPPLESVSLDADFTPFMQAKVPEALKRQALKTLFKDAHFNTMDGLDTYIDDYTKFEPISDTELAGLSAWKSITNPLKQVVTPGGYAVDVESEEGKAVLAARAAAGTSEEVATRGPLPPGGGGSREAGGEGDLPLAAAFESEASPSPLNKGEGIHARYGKRVSDFKPDTVVAAALQTEKAALTRPIGRPLPLGEVETIDDPR